MIAAAARTSPATTIQTQRGGVQRLVCISPLSWFGGISQSPHDFGPATGNPHAVLLGGSPPADRK
jgi:hypothetical protein